VVLNGGKSFGNKSEIISKGFKGSDTLLRSLTYDNYIPNQKVRRTRSKDGKKYDSSGRRKRIAEEFENSN
jgi:hypothetical protein